jgi:hypothetical protein
MEKRRNSMAQTVMPQLANLYGIDVSGFYYGSEKSHKTFNGRRAGSVSNLKSAKWLNLLKFAAFYLRSRGIGFDLIFLIKTRC